MDWEERYSLMFMSRDFMTWQTYGKLREIREKSSSWLSLIRNNQDKDQESETFHKLTKCRRKLPIDSEFFNKSGLMWQEK